MIQASYDCKDNDGSNGNGIVWYDYTMRLTCGIVIILDELTLLVRPSRVVITARSTSAPDISSVNLGASPFRLASTAG